MDYYGDDMVVSPFVREVTLFEHMQSRFQTNGKMLCDGVAYAFYYVPMWVWKVFNIGVFVFVGMLLSHLFSDNSNVDFLAVSAMILMFPIDYLVTAGWIATCSNYLYTTLAVLIIGAILKKIVDNQRCKWWCHLIGLAAILYATNQDQSAMIVIGGTLLFWFHAKFLRGDNESVQRWVIAYFLVSLICYLCVFFSPGHLLRMKESTVDSLSYLPEYGTWNFLQKLYHGYSATMAHIIFEQNKLAGLFSVLLFLTALYSDGIFIKLIAAIPIGTFAVLGYVDERLFIHKDYWLPDFRQLTSKGGLVALVISVIVLCSILYTIFSVVKSNKRYVLLGLLVLGGGSRLMMGFTSTLYFSSYRTFTYLVFALIACCLVLLDEQKKLKKGSAHTIGVACTIVCFMIN